MNDGKSEQEQLAGAAVESQVAIEYSWQTLNEIRGYVLDGMKRRALGIAVGGVLFGARGENLVRILTWRPIRCEHSLGPSFHLSQKDRIHLGKFLQTSRYDPELSDMHALGWFVCHLGTGVELTESDLNVFNHFFPWSWQITLVIEPERDGSAKAGFFFRDAEGAVKADSSYRQFDVEPDTAADVSQETMVPGWAQTLPTNTQRHYPAPSIRRWFPRDQRLWIWAVPLLLALVVGAMLFSRPSSRAVVPSISFHIVDDGAESRFEWDKQAAPVREAIRGSLEIRDGVSNMEVPLETDRLREGRFSYSRKTNDLEVLITVYPVNGQPVQESARFVGSPVNNSSSDDAPQIRRERDSLANEVVRLRESLRRETLRSSRLEEAMRILQNRVQTEEQRRPRSAVTENK